MVIVTWDARAVDVVRNENGCWLFDPRFKNHGANMVQVCALMNMIKVIVIVYIHLKIDHITNAWAQSISRLIYGNRTSPNNKLKTRNDKKRTTAAGPHFVASSQFPDRPKKNPQAAPKSAKRLPKMDQPC